MALFDAVIFDWAGTTVDYGCFAPVQAFADAFGEYGIRPTMDEIRGPMGMLKRDHVRTMLEMERISREWERSMAGRLPRRMWNRSMCSAKARSLAWWADSLM